MGFFGSMDYYEFCKRYVSMGIAGMIVAPIFLLLLFFGLDKVLPLYVLIIIYGTIVVVLEALLYPILKKKKLL